MIHKKQAVSTLTLVLVLIASVQVFGQTAEEIFELDFIAAEKAQEFGRPDVERARYFVGMGLGELRGLNNRILALDEESEVRRVLLTEALADVLRILDSIDSTKGPATEADSARLIAAFTNPETAKRVFMALGPERTLELVSAGLTRKLESIAVNARKNDFTPVSFLNNKAVSKLLSLTDEQREELDLLTKQATEKMRVGADDEFKKLELLLDQHWQQILATLNLSQRPVARKLVGEPIQWFRSAGEHRLRSRDFSRGGLRAGSSKARELRTKDGRMVFQMSAEELQSHGLTYVYSHIIEMFKTPFVWDELELTAEQKEEIRELGYIDIVASEERYGERLRQLVADETELPDFATSILTEQQQEWFVKMELQILTGKFEASVGLLHPDLIERLGLTADQTGKIKVLADKYSKAANKLTEVINAGRAQVQLQFVDDANALLTEEQLKLFRKLTGKFDAEFADK